MLIPPLEYNKIVDLMPILCVDVIIRSSDGEKVILVKRNNEPRKGEWWVIGGRVLKGETLEQAVARKMWEEAGIYKGSVKPKCLGYYEGLFQEHRFDFEGLLHTVSIVFEVRYYGPPILTLDSQSSEWKWSEDLPKGLYIKGWHE